jgi:hypothetical protein
VPSGTSLLTEWHVGRGPRRSERRDSGLLVGALGLALSFRPCEWRPGITFVQTLIDLINATNWTSALPQALAHDYRLEGPLGVRLAFGHHDVPREAAARIADELIAQEVANGAHLREARRRYTAPR